MNNGHDDDHAGHDHAGHDNAGHDHAGHDHVGHDHAGHDHAGHDHAGHSHSHADLGRRALLLALVFNFSFLFIEAGVGVWTQSLALMSDAVHMFTDVLALTIALLAATARLKPRGGVATFGHARVAVLGGLTNGVLALLASVWIVVEAIERLQSPPTVPGLPVLITAVIGLVVNLASAAWLHGSGDSGVNMRAALLHMLGDALGSVAAIIAGVTLMMGGPLVVDPIVSVIVGAIVVGSAIPLLRDATNILLERAPRALDLQAVEATITDFAEAREVAALHVWSLDDGDVMASVVVTTDGADLNTLVGVADTMRETLRRKHRIVHTTIEWRPVGLPGSCCPVLQP
jgi:cobalt-zinc-cadmium efflux system protein